MKTSISLISVALLALLAGTVTSAAASAEPPRVIIKCSADGGDCHRKPTPPAPATLPPDQAGDAQVGLMAAPMMMAPPSLAAPSMPPAPSAVATIPESAHAACARRKAGSKVTLQLGSQTSVHGVCEKEGGKMRFRMRDQQRIG